MPQKPHNNRFLKAAFLALATACLPFQSMAQIDSEKLIGSTCATAGQNAADWDTFAECPSNGGTWTRGPIFVGTTSDSCDTNHGGMLYWTGTAMQYCNGTAWGTFGISASPSVFSSLTGATATHSFDNVAYAQVWGWSTNFTTQNAFTLSSTSETTGSLLTITAANTAATGPVVNVSTTSTGGAVAVKAAATGTNNTAAAGYFTNNNATGYGVFSSGVSPSYFGGNINLAPAAFYDVGGNKFLSLVGGDSSTISIGAGAAGLVNTGTGVTAIGGSALFVNGANNNTGLGFEAAPTNTTGTPLTAAGEAALNSTTAGPNDGLGYNAGYNISTGTGNVAFGNGTIATGSAQVTGNNNSAIGYLAGAVLAGAAASNTAIGYEALKATTTGSQSTAAGSNALLAATGANDAFGYNAGKGITTGTSNVALGEIAMVGALTGAYNTAVGYDALSPTASTATSNTAVGAQAGFKISSGSYNTAFGENTLAGETTGTSNTAFGQNTLSASTGTSNESFGTNTLSSAVTSTNNLAFGNATLNTFAAAGANTHVAVGAGALNAVTSGSGHTAIGYQAGSAGSTPLTGGAACTFIGFQTQTNAASYTNATAIGAGAILTASNAIVLGNSSISAIYAKVTSITGISDRRRKKDIADLPADLGLEFIGKLKPVSYHFNNGDETQRYGFIAQDMEQALPPPLQNIVETAQPEKGLALLSRDTTKDRFYHVAYGELTAPIVKAIQEQQSQIKNDRAYMAQVNTQNPSRQLQYLGDSLDNTGTIQSALLAGGAFASLCLAFFLTRRKKQGPPHE